MKVVDEKELENITGGVSAWIWVGIGAAVVFALGFVDGLVHPKGCDIS